MGELVDFAEVFQIRQKIRDYGKSKSQIESEHKEFAENRPQMFDMITRPDCDDLLLNKMLSAHRLVSQGKMTQHDASVFMGEQLVDKYVKPSLPPKND
tara:strand:+ start:219 stop:512 length:294 start_codon:yes stop_codon:yes gene_type:complete